ncbi:MAG: MFS transporter [Actinomycetota bacterium]
MPPPAPIRLRHAPAAVLAAAGRLGGHETESGTVVFPAEPDRHPAIEATLTVRPEPSGSAVTVSGRVDLAAVPFFGGVLRPLIAVARRRAERHLLDRLRAELDGEDHPPTPGHLLGMPPVPFSAEQVTLLAVAGAATAVTSFAAALFGQLSGPISETFGASDARIGVALAITRTGAILALVLTALADRRGRRALIIIGMLGSSLSCGISAVAPSLDIFTAGQVLQRGFAITTFTVAGIAVIEEAPEGARAYAASMLALAGGLGFSFAVVVLPFGDAGTGGWRIPFLLGAASLLLVRPIAGRLVETRRYAAVAARTDVTRGRLSEIVDRQYRRRFLLLAGAAFLTSVFNAPSSQLMNKYLEDVRDFSSTGIALFRAVTTALPGLIGILIGGRLADARGRRPVAAIGLLVATITQMGFFLVGGPPLWFLAAASVVTASAGGLALGTMDAELFATEVRSTSNAILTVLAVTGSGLGLLLAGALSDPLGGLGRSIALMGVAAVFAAIVVIPRLPETASLSLDDVSPTETGTG